jgi:hypothetical protein
MQRDLQRSIEHSPSYTKLPSDANERRIYGVWTVEERPPPHVVPTYHDSSSKKAGIDANHDDVVVVSRDGDASVYKEYC